MDALFGELSEIEILDVWEGMSHLGNSLDLYYEALRRFCEEFDDQFTALINTLAQEDWKNYTIRIHAFKGAFANLGAEELRARSYDLEMASKNGEYDKCRGKMAETGEAMKAFRDRLLNTSLMQTNTMVQ
ncbi:MAG: Hpt domain-containing protein [Treponema sp.]|jgi:HPt (histidine-containing phosphotransfer) domain-containing protein|nr:Hpt domain-containing protein [Treponema sp.]